MFLVNVQEAFGIHPNEVMDMSLSLVHSMLTEYGFMWRERNREETEGKDAHGEYEWIELPDWDDPTKTNRVKMYHDVGSFVK